jgi:hypothetical protein
MRIRWLVVVAWSILTVVAASAQEPQPVSLDEFKRILQNTQDALSGQARPSLDRNFLPEMWSVREGKGEFRVSTSWLRNGLKEMEATPKDSGKIRASLLDKLKALRAECDALGGVTSVNAERGRLNAILGRREFGKVRGPTLWDKIKQKINEFLIRMLSSLFGSEVAPEIGKILIWLVILAGAGILGLWAWRLLSRPADVPTIAARLGSLPPKDWRDWLAEARRAADSGDWRDAIRRAYWAAVYRLEERGVWRSDRARTPREYLRQLDKTSPYRLPLNSLTTVFERTWYAGDSADASAFGLASDALEKLECQ